MMAYCLHCVHCVFVECIHIVDESGGPSYLSYYCAISDKSGDELNEEGGLDFEKDCPNYELNEAMIKACHGRFSYQTAPGIPTSQPPE